MINAWRNSSPPLASRLQQTSNALVPAISSHLDQAAVVVPVPLGICARVEENLHGIRVSLAHRKMNRLSVKVLRPAQFRIAVKETLKHWRVSSRSGCNRVP